MPRRFTLPRLAAMALLAFVLDWQSDLLRAQEIYDEETIKAAFIYHFSTFVAWPAEQHVEPAFVIAVLGDVGVAGELARYLPGRTIQGRPMQVRVLESVAELRTEQVIFLGAERNDVLPGDLEAIGNRPILVVTDAEGALAKGSMINFRLVDQRVRFEISVPAAEQAGLILSSRLLAAAMHVDTTSGIARLPDESMVSNRPFLR